MIKIYTFIGGDMQKNLASLLAATFVGPLFAPAAWSQTESAQLEEVVVTARRRLESVSDVPISITALGADYLTQAGVETIEDLRTHVPSFGVSVAGSSVNTPIISLRGQRIAESIITLDSSIPVYVSEVAMTPTHGTNLALYDVNSVEVLKGPQGTLFGRNSTGGAMLINLAKPGAEQYLRVDVGNYGKTAVEGAVDVNLSSANALRLAARVNRRDGFQDNVADNDLAGSNAFWDADDTSYRLTWQFKPSENFENTLTFNSESSDTAARVPTPLGFRPQAQLGGLVNIIHNGGLGFIGSPAVDAALERQATRAWTEVETDLNATEALDQEFISNILEYAPSDDVKVRAILGYRELTLENSSDVDGTALPIFGTQTSTTAATTLAPPLTVIEAEQTSLELQALGSLASGGSWLLGVSSYELDASQSSPTQVIGANPSWPPIPAPSPQLGSVWFFAQNGFAQNSPSGDVNNEALAVFGEVDLPLSEALTLTLGARQTWDDRSVTVSNTRLGRCNVADETGQPLSGACERAESKSFSAPTWRAALSFAASEATNVFASLSTGYRTGGFNLRGSDNAGLAPYDEETVLNAEVGLKSNWVSASGASVALDLAAYWQDYKDIQKTQPAVIDGTFATSTVNAASGTVQGLEAALTWSPTPRVQFNIAYAFTDAGYDEWLLPQPDGSTLDITGRPFTWIPEHSLSAMGRFDLLSSDVGDIDLVAHIYWQDDVFASDKDPFETEILRDSQVESAYSVLDLRLNWGNVMGSNVDLSAYLKNASDKAYGVGGLNVLQDLGWVSRVYGAPRTYGVVATYRF